MGLVSLSYHGGYAFGVVDRLPSAVGRDDEMVQGGLDVGAEYTSDVVEGTSDVFRTLEVGFLGQVSSRGVWRWCGRRFVSVVTVVYVPAGTPAGGRNELCGDSAGFPDMLEYVLRGRGIGCVG